MENKSSIVSNIQYEKYTIGIACRYVAGIGSLLIK